jgi:transcriptional regulator of acetoin/glycerol metabolism
MNISPDALDVLLRYNWPGNVIQLENVIERAFALRVDLTIEVDDLPSEIKTFEEISKMS